MSTPRWAVGLSIVLRDTVSWIFAWGLIFKQAGIYFDPPSQISLPILLIAGLIIGVPGLANLAAIRLGGSSGTDGPPSPQASPSPQPSSPTSSVASSGAE